MLKCYYYHHFSVAFGKGDANFNNTTYITYNNATHEYVDYISL